VIQESEKSRYGQLGGPSSYPGEIEMKSTTILSAFMTTVAAHCAFAQNSATAAAGPMGTARMEHTATLLQDGRVLIAGGQTNADVALPTTEIYDPATQSFSPAGNMTTARVGHTATLLPDGRVLLIGGDAVGTAEVYDPTTGLFTATGSLLTARTGFNTTLLSSGNVLVTGGFVEETPSAFFIGDAELYDPSTEVFTRAPTYAGVIANNTSPVFGFGSTSTLLPNGTVLFATEPASQVYDPASATFSLRGPVTITTQWGTVFTPDYIVDQSASLLLNGKVLVAGGEQEDTGRFNSARLYDPASGLFLPTGSMMRARANHTATLLPDGSVLMAGGESQNCDFDGASISCWFSGTESSMELYDPVQGVFTNAGNMSASRELHTATLLNNGDVLIAGGLAYAGIGMYTGTTASAELYHPSSPSPAPALFPIWHAASAQLVSPQVPAVAGEFLSMYVSGLAEGGGIPPQVAVGGQSAEVLFFGDAPGYPGYSQVNFSLPIRLTPGPGVPVHLTYLWRTSNEVTIAVH
jgi:hypothetical protein